MKQSLIWLLAILTPIATYSQEANPHRSKTLLAEKGLFTPTKYCIYNINSIEDGGTLLTLQDGSEWHIALNTSHITLQWLHDDPIIISLPSFDTVCPYKYTITNQRRKGTVLANLFKGPSEEAIVRIEHIDHQGKYLCLTDGSQWHLDDPCDGGHTYFSEGGRYPHRFYRWQVGHKILQGRSGAWFSKKRHLLINVDEKNHLAAVLLKSKKGEIQ